MFKLQDVVDVICIQQCNLEVKDVGLSTEIAIYEENIPGAELELKNIEI